MTPSFGLPAELAELSDDYEFLSELGRGGSAVVYRARDRALGREVAVKVVHPRPTSPDDDPVARLAHEARTVAQLQHPRIVTVYAVRRLRGGGLALVLQLVPGTTLKACIQRDGALPPERAQSILRDVAEALAYAHARGIVHRDVKPENIFLDEDTGRALLADFGIARSGETESMTLTGTAIGTPFYMSPEQVEGATLDGRSDLYSLGLVAWEMLTGRRPWDGESLYNVIYKQKHDELAPIEALRPEVPRRLQYIVERMLQKRPGARWAGADGLLAQLNHAVLPADYAKWQTALPARVERHRSRERERAAAAADVTAPASAATMRFPRRTRQPDPAAEAALARTQRVSLATAMLGEGSASAHRLPSPDDALATGDADAGEAADTSTVTIVHVPADSTPTSRATDASRQAAPDSVPAELPSPLFADEIEPVWDTAPPATERRARRGAVIAAAAAVTLIVATAAVPFGVHGARTLLSHLRRQTSAPTAATLAAATGVTLPTGTPALPGESPPVHSTASDDVVAAGGRSSCAVAFGSGLYCWGANDRGQLGDASGFGQRTPARVTGVLSFVQVTVGLAHGCALTRLGDAYCWGVNNQGQLGDATFVRRIAPVRVAGAGSYVAVRAGAAHSCAVDQDGTIRCWGANDRGQLGTGDRTASPIPVPVRLPADTRAVRVASGAQHACALTDTGRVFCWGANGDGQLGDGTRTDRLTPVQLRGDDGVRYAALAAGGAHSCAATAGGDVRCWGRGDNGQIGVGTRERSTQPASVRLPAGLHVREVTAGFAHTCALGADGDAWCWGRNTHGEIGDGTIFGRLTPTRVRTLERFAHVSAGAAHTCAVGIAGTLFCWGFNADGQVGDSTTFRRVVPTSVALPAGTLAAVATQR